MCVWVYNKSKKKQLIILWPVVEIKSKSDFFRSRHLRSLILEIDNDVKSNYIS